MEPMATSSGLQEAKSLEDMHLAFKHLSDASVASSPIEFHLLITPALLNAANIRTSRNEV